MISFMRENKRLLNIHEQKFAKLAAFQANTTVFQGNTNASLKNLEAQVGQLVLTNFLTQLPKTKLSPRKWHQKLVDQFSDTATKD